MVVELEITRAMPPTVTRFGSDSPPARFAADELARYLGMILGGEGWPSDPGVPDATSRAVMFELGVDVMAGLSDEESMWDANDGCVRIVAGGALGLVFGVYAFLRDVCGCRFSGLGPDGEHVPNTPRLKLKIEPARRAPLLPYRAIQFYYRESPALYRAVIDWMAKNGFNYVHYHLGSPGDRGNDLEVDPHTGEPVFPEGRESAHFSEAYFQEHLLPEIRRRGLKLDMNHHNLRYWLPPQRYAAAHPQWYAQVAGRRAASFSQLCICTSNDEAVATLIANVRSYLRANPQVGIVGVVPEDGHGMCECEACVATDGDLATGAPLGGDHRRAESEAPALVVRYVRLLNHVARELRDEFPHVLIGGMAYVDLQWPPRRERLEPNVTMNFAVYWRDGARPLMPADAGSPINELFAKLLRRWRDNWPGLLTLYEYYMGMNAQRGLPYPQAAVICREWPYLRQAGIQGASIQCSADCHQAYALNLLAFARIAWDDRADAGAVLREFLQGMFGDAAPAVAPLYEAMEQAAAAWRTDVSLQPDAMNVIHFGSALRRVGVGRSLRRARQLARDPRQQRQVESLRRYLLYCLLAERANREVLASQRPGASPRQACIRARRAADKHIPRVLDCLGTLPRDGWVPRSANAKWRSARQQLLRQIEKWETPAEQAVLAAG